MFDKKGPLPYSVKQGRRIRMCMACSGQFLASEPMLNRILYTFIWIHVLFFHVHYTSPYIDRNLFTKGMLSMV